MGTECSRRRRQPETGVLYRAVQEELMSFLAMDERLPVYVARAFERFLDCGILARGFGRLRCGVCGHEMVVAFSCKGRGVCPSCQGRRMSDQAAHLVDRVFPRAPVRQWVLSVPKRVRYHLARSGELKREALGIFLGEVFAGVRGRVPFGRRGEAGAVTVVQRFGSALNLNVHFHSLVLDGVYLPGAQGQGPRFREAAAPTRTELEVLVRRLRDRINALLGDEGEGEPESAEQSGLFEQIQAASVQERIALAPEPRRVTTVGRDESAEPDWTVPRGCAAVDGYSVHAGVRVRAGGRAGLERLCRYVLRPPFSQERFVRLPDGRIAYGLRRPWRDGTSHVVLTPLELMEKLAALVPRPWEHGVHYHGILAPNARMREEIVPRVEREPETPPRGPGRLGLDWATLMRRSFEVDVLRCPRCGGRMRWVECVTREDRIREVLRAMGEAEEAPAPAPARGPPQGEFEWTSEGESGL